ncbi:MAG TPA: TerC family protein [Acidimicrobiales bacterium]|nr:TerC family protein [Acidimicrobiales bacterium]
MRALLLASEASDKLKLNLDVPAWQWGAFLGLVVTLVLLDMLVFHRDAHEVSIKAAAVESAVWISLGLSFTFVMWWLHGGTAAGQYLSGYLIEESLSIDNVFVWAVILTFFAVPQAYRFRVLFWGIFGALVLRAVFIFAGVALVERFDWLLYIFGAFLIYTAYKISRHDEAEVHPDQNLALRLVRKIVPSTNEYDGQKMFTRVNGKRVATPLFAVLVMVESTDVLFAVDSIPAIFAVSQEQFVIFTSNAFAILGLRALYFCLAGMADKFRYLNTGLGVILAFVGVKMILATADVWHPPTWLALTVIIGVLAVSVIASLRADARDHDASEHDDTIEELVQRSHEHEHQHDGDHTH